MKKFEDSDFFGKGEDIIAIYLSDYKKELRPLNEELFNKSKYYRRIEISSEKSARRNYINLKQ